jgi:hypothetical protein
MLVLLAADAAWAASRAYGSLTDARDGLRVGARSLESGDLPAADIAFSNASTQGANASSALAHPGVTVLSWLPWISNDVDAVRRVARSASLSGQAGKSYAGAARAVGWDGATVPGFAPGGRIDAPLLRAAEPGLNEAADLLGRAKDELAPVDPASLASALQQPVEDAQQEVEQRAEQASTAADLVSLLPEMLGADGARTYLLVTLSPSDPRGSGGYPGVFGLLHLDGGRLRLGDLAPTSTIPQVKPVDAPDDVRRRWGSYGSLTTFWDTTYTPDFPTAATLMTEIWESGGGQPVDGVIAGDPALMAAFLAVLGPVDSPVWPETITTTNVERIVGADTYRTLDQVQSDAWQVGIGTSLWQAFFTRPWPMRAMASAISGAAEDGHLQVWSGTQTEQEALQRLGVTGAVGFPDDGSPLVTINGFTANRAGYFAHVETRDTRDAVGPDGQGYTTTIVVRNEAPTGPPSILLGDSRADTGGEPIGTFGAEVNVYVPADVTGPIDASVDGHPQIAFPQPELGRTAYTINLLVPPGKSVTVEFAYPIGT